MSFGADAKVYSPDAEAAVEEWSGPERSTPALSEGRADIWTGEILGEETGVAP